MNVTFACPQCEQAARQEIQPGDREYVCPHCRQAILIPPGALAGGTVRRCVACPSADLFVRKDFPQQLGVGIVVAGFIASSIPWAYGYPLWTYAILFATALLDVLLYLFVPNCLMCYRCGAQYRGAAEIDAHGAFDLETHERHRQHTIRLGEARAAAAATHENSATQQETSH